MNSNRLFLPKKGGIYTGELYTGVISTDEAIIQFTIHRRAHNPMQYPPTSPYSGRNRHRSPTKNLPHTNKVARSASHRMKVHILIHLKLLYIVVTLSG